MLQVTFENRLPDSLIEIIHCLAFWNKNANRVYEQNKERKLGSKRSQDEAIKTPFDIWQLNSILYDLQTITENKPYKCGKGGSHVWLSNNDNERIIIITVS